MRQSKRTTRLIFSGCLTVFLFCCGQTKKQRIFFLEKVKGLGGIIVKQASADMNLCNMYNTVWEYAKVTGLDFRSAYREMNLDTSNIEMQMETNMQMMDRLMNMIKSPPENMAGIYDKLIELRESYLEFNKFVLQMPQVSQEEYNAEAGAQLARIDSLKGELDGLISTAEANL